MKKLLMLASLLGAGTSYAQTLAPFGIKQGMTVAELLKLGAKPSSTTPGYYTLDKVPTPNKAFDFYTVKASPKQGVCRVSGAGNSINDDGYGTKTKAEFSAMEKLLIGKYGPNDKEDSIKSNAIYSLPNEWLSAIESGERDYDAYWDKGSGAKLPSNVALIALYTRALDSKTGYISVSYRFTNADACDAELKGNDQQSPNVPPSDGL